MKREFATAVVSAIMLACCGLVRLSEGGEAPQPAEGGGFRLPLSDDGWLDVRAPLVASDGSRSLGNHRARFNDSRDRGSKIVFFDPVKGDNETADVYWWDGKQMVDSAGKAANPKNGRAYGANPLEPDEEAIRPFREGVGMVRNADADPRRDIFSRNIYQGGGAMMGHRYLGIISADGGSGGPQMRLGGRIEGSLIIEGYWFSAVSSNKLVNPWLVRNGQSGQSAVVRNNVQLVYAYPTPRDPDTAKQSSGAAQPGWGYTLQGASFGALVEGNIVSQAMLIDELGAGEGGGGFGIGLTAKPETYEDGKAYSQRNNTIRGNIAYRTGAGLQITGDWSGVKGNVVEGNVVVAKNAVRNSATAVDVPKGLAVRNNRFYCDGGLPAESGTEPGNSVAAYASAAATERWPDPNRTLNRYVTEVLKLTLLDWKDDPLLDPAARDARAAAGESYDPSGLKTFMAVATNMRRGGVTPVPTAGKPSWTGDYAWDERLTGRPVVNWIREGFGLPRCNAAKD